jgi:2-polyprenyl-6-methoxyphenol hydroxylase-like FAD-dependent oxidoreductase
VAPFGVEGHTRTMTVSSIAADVCIVGGGPAGIMLGYLLARAGIPVVVLEKHKDFFRDFRGDTIHPSTLALLDQLGLREEFLTLPHNEVRSLDFVVNGTRLHPIDFSRLRKPNDFLTFMPQWDFLNFLADKGREYPEFQLIMGADATGTLRKGGTTVGVTATDADGADFEVHAPLTIAADGRASTVRAASGLVPREFGIAIDVLWFHLPKPAKAPKPTLAYIDASAMVLTIDRGDYYQAGMVIPKGDFASLKAEGLDAFRKKITRSARLLTPVVSSLTSWDDVKLLSVQVDRLSRWHRPGLLCIGDAAHAMSPAFGVGVNYAIQDAVATANLLVTPLRRGSVTDEDLERVQRRRKPPVSLMQPIQLQVHKVIARPGGGAILSRPPTASQRAALRILIPIARRIMPRLLGLGFRPERITAELLER